MMSIGYGRAFALWILAIASCGLLGCGAGEEKARTCDDAARWVTRVVETRFGTGPAFGHDRLPEIVYGPPKGAGCCGGSLDVASLGEGGAITVAFDQAIVDGPGADFIVFENAFAVANDTDNPYAEIATVEVSADGVTWTAFPCTATKFPYGSCAGWHPVFGNEEAGVDPLDPAVAGGDQYDLADIGVPLARYVRITDRADVPGSFDLDAVGIVNAECLPGSPPEP